jgi:hypothetical protein
MGYTTAGLNNGGRTDHYQISYDTALPAPLGLALANQLFDSCEYDFQLMQSWFAGVNFKFSFPINVQLTNGTSGAGWSDPSNEQRTFGYSLTVSIQVGPYNTSEFVRYLLVSEVTEMFMASQNTGWFVSAKTFHGGDEGSKGEGLSRFLGLQFYLQSTIQNFPYAPFVVVGDWLNSPGRPNYVDNNPDDHSPDPVTGCTAGFIWYLCNQLGFSINAIVANGASTLGGVYAKLTGRNDGWQSFSNLITLHYPPGITYNPVTDNLFPVPNLDDFADVQITSGSTETVFVALDRVAPAEVVVTLASGNPSLLTITPNVTIGVGTWSVGVTLTAAAVTGPTQVATISASYAGKTLVATVQVLPRPSILQGQVFDTSHKPIGGASVLLSAPSDITTGNGTTMQLTTDASGVYETPPILPQTYQIVAVEDGFVTGQATVNVGLGVPLTVQNFMLVRSQPFTVKGKVTSSLGLAVAGAAMTLDINSAIPGRLHATTDANGNYTMSTNPSSYIGNYTLTASSAGFVPASATFIIPNGATLTKNLVLTALGALTGTVNDSGSRPIPGATVAADQIAAQCGSAGQYDLSPLTPGATNVSASAIGFDPVSMQMTIAPAQPTTYNFALAPASAIIAGSVTDLDGNGPIPNANVSVADAGAAVTEANGSYSVAQVSAGSHTISVAAKGFLTQQVSVQIVAGQHLNVNFLLENVIAHAPQNSDGQPM